MMKIGLARNRDRCFVESSHILEIE